MFKKDLFLYLNIDSFCLSIGIGKRGQVHEDVEMISAPAVGDQTGARWLLFPFCLRIGLA